MSDLSIQGEVVVNSEKAESAFDRVGDKASQMANEVATSANKAGQAVDGIGAGAEKGAEKFTRAEARMRDSIKRSTQELQLLGKTASEKLEFNIQAKGLDASKFSGYIAELKKAEAAQQIATGSLDKMGVSAKQTAAALRGVPAQFTDIVTSLQGGQAPLTVFLQQGGQLKDMFGGAGNAARALGGYVVGLINPFTLAAAAVGGLAFAYNQGSKEADAYRAALVTTGNAAGTNAAQLKSYAQEISSVVGTQGKAAEALSALAATGKVGAENLREAAQAAVAYERATGQAASKTAEQFAALRNEPLSAVLKLNDGMNFLTESTYRQIKSLEEQGKTAEAANVAQRAFADTLSGRAGEMERNLGTVERGWLAVKDAAKGAWDAILNVGRSATNVDQLAEVRKQIAQRENQLANGGFGTNEGGAAFGRPSQAATERLRAELQGLQAKAAALEGVAYATKVAADEERKRGESVKASAAFDKAGEKFLTDKARMERELAAARVQGAEAGRSQAEIEKRLGEIRASYAKKGGSSVATENKDLRDQQRIFAELAGVSSTYYAELANAQKQRAAGVITEQQYVTAVQSLIEKQPFAVALAKEEAAATQALSKAYAEAAAERIKTIQSMERAADGLQSQNDALREEIELIGLSTEQQTLVLQQRNDALILTKEATLAELERQSAITGTQTRVEIALASEIEALKERNALLGAKGVKNAAVDAAKTAKDEWQKTTDSINQTLTDSLMRGFESGKDMARNLRDTVVSMFKTMVLRPVISAIINPISGALTGMMGLSGAAQAGQGASALGGIGNVASLASGIGSFTTAGMLPTGIATALTGSTSSLAMGLSGAWGAGGGMLSTLNAGASMLGSGSIMSGLGTLAGALGPIALGIAALAAIFGKKATPHAGAASTYSEAGGLVSGADIYRASGLADTRTYNAGVEQVTGNVAKAIGDTLNATARTFGKEAGYEISTAFADDTSKDGAWGSLMIRRGGESVIDWRDTQTSKWAPREFADGEAGSKEYLAAVAKSARDALVGAIGDVDWATDMLTALGDSPTLEGLAQTVQQINAAQAAFDALGKNIVGFGALTDGAISALVKAAGGIDGLVSAASAYYDNFYSESEKAANVTRDVTAALADVGLEMPKTRDEFRALVESQMALGESGAPAVAALLGVSGAFAALTPALDAMVSSVGINAEQISTTLRDGLLGRISGEEMGASIGTMITNGIQNAIAGSFADQITQIFMQGIVNPVIQAAMTGSSISAAVSQASIDAMVQQAQSAATAIGAILNDPGFQSAMAQIQAAIGSFTTAASVGYRAPVVSGGGGGGGGGYDNSGFSDSVEAVDTAWKDLLKSIVESTLAAQTELSRLGMTSYERALAEIDDKANDLLKQIAEDRGFAAKRTELAVAEQRQSAFSDLAARIRASVAQDGDVLVNGGMTWLSEAGRQYQREADAAAEAIARLKAELTDMPDEVRKLIEAEKALLEARNALRAMEITGDLRTDIERLGMSDMERTLAGIGDRAKDYIKSLEDIGQATEDNIGIVGEWEAAMRQAAINRVDSQAADLTGGLQKEIDRLGMSDLERALAGINDKASDYIKSLQDLDRATDANIGAVNDWEDAMRLDAIKQAWSGVTDSILGEIDRIRGSLSGDSGLAAMQAEFAINTAAARAGDMEAGGTLAKLSGDILRLSEGNAGSAFDWARMQAQMLASLQETARITSLMGGGMSPVSAASFIAPSQSNEISTPYMPPVPQQGAGNAELIAEIRLLNKRLETLEANTQATALHTQKTSKALERAMPGGDAIATREVAA